MANVHPEPQTAAAETPDAETPAVGATDTPKVASYDEQQLDPQEYARLLDLYDNSFRNIAEGEVVKGTVLKVTETEVVVDVGFKSEGIIAVDEFLDENRQVMVQPGDVVSLASRSRDMIAFTAPMENARPPAYLQLDREKRSVRVSEIPERDQIPVQCEASLIVEFYSR